MIKGKRKRREKFKGFTLLEMLMVLFIIAVLILIFVPNISTQKAGINDKGDQAFEKVFRAQVELYHINENKAPEKMEDLLQAGYLTEEQIKKADELKLKINE